MSKPKADLTNALVSAGGGTRRRTVMAPSNDPPPPVPDAEPPPTTSEQRPDRVGTAPITNHFPIEVRDQLKILAIEQRMTMHDLTAEAFNDLFAKYGKPEIAPKTKPDTTP